MNLNRFCPEASHWALYNAKVPQNVTRKNNSVLILIYVLKRLMMIRELIAAL